MAVIGLRPIVMGDDDQLAIAALITRIGDCTAIGSPDGRTIRGGNIDPGVIAVAAKNIPAAEVGGDPPPNGPLVASGGGRLGLLLGAHRLHRLGGLPQGGRAVDDPPSLLTIDIGDGGVHLGLALHSLGDDLAAPFVQGGVLDLFHRAGNRLHIGHIVHRLHRKQGGELLDIEHIAHHQAVDVH